MTHLVLLEDSVFDNGAYVGAGPAVQADGDPATAKPIWPTETA
jgi:hypothetical protein